MSSPSLSTTEQFLRLLKTSHLQTAASLAKELKITKEAARLQLLKLTQEGLVQSVTEARGVGRPTQLWTLTKLGHARFPDRHAGLTAQLLASIRTVLGEEALEELLTDRTRQTLAAYTQAMAGSTQLSERLAVLTNLRTEEGYMADCIKDEQGYLLTEHNCPICTAAAACQGFCRAELSIFEQILGSQVSVTRVSHILAGASRCAYRIQVK
jgi:predicted ArsR family transcriptional regulator